MNYRDYVIPKLRELNKKRLSIDNLRDQIETKEMEFTALRAAKTDGDPVSGGTNHREDMLLNNICERDYLKAMLRVTIREINTVDRALSEMDKTERYVLETFYVNRPSGYIEEIESSLHIERSQVYRVKDRALVNFTKLLCGTVML